MKALAKTTTGYPSPMEAVMTFKQRLKLGRYEELEPLPSGELVYHDTHLDKPASVRWLAPWVSKPLVCEKVRRLQAIHSPHLIIPYDVIEEPGRVGVVEEPQNPRLAPAKDEAQRLLQRQQLCAGMAALHEAGLVHGQLEAKALFSGPAGACRVGNIGFDDVEPTVAQEQEALTRLLMGLEGVLERAGLTEAKASEAIHTSVPVMLAATGRDRGAADKAEPTE